MLSYRVMLDVPFQLAAFMSGLLAEHRREIGTRAGTRALTCWKQAVFALAWFRDRPDIRRLGVGFGISQATACRYKDEAIEVLAAKAPSLREALDVTRQRDGTSGSPRPRDHLAGLREHHGVAGAGRRAAAPAIGADGHAAPARSVSSPAPVSSEPGSPGG